MKQTVTYAPPNSIFFIEDRAGGTAPDIDHRIPCIWWSRSSLIIGTLAYIDGDTTLTVSDSQADAPSGNPAAQMTIDCPSGELHVSTSHLEVLLRIKSVSNPAKLSVWINRPSNPDEMFVLVE